MDAPNIKEELYSITAELEKCGLDYALCGGLAVIIHGYVRATMDIDFLILEKNFDSVKASLKTIGYSLDGGIMPFDIGKPTERRVGRISKVFGEDLLTVDLIFATGPLEEVWKTREALSIDGHPIQCVSLEGLKTMKSLAGRPQDLTDISELDKLRE